MCRQFVHTPPLAAGLIALARIRQTTGDADGALAAADEAEQSALGPPGLFNPVPAQRARLLLARGNLADAARWTQESGLDADDPPDYPREAGHLVLVRVMLAQARSDRALALLNRLHAAAVAEDRIGSVIELGAVRALALAAGGKYCDAVAALAETLMLAYPERLIRVFADEGEPMAALLRKLITDQRTEQVAARVPIGYLAELQLAMHPARDGAPTAPGLVENLTVRETEVLDLLASGRSNQAIASELVVTVDTVKKHVSHVLEKLGATNRTEAVARARELHLIS